MQCAWRWSICVTCVWMLSSTANAADWEFVPTAEAKIDYQTNRRLTLSPHEAVWAESGSGSISIERNTEVSTFRLQPMLTVTRVPRDKDLNSDGQLVNSGYRVQTPRGRWQLDANYTRDTTLTSELEDTGLLQVRKRRNRWSLNPTGSFSLTQRTQVQGGVSYTNTRYQNAALTGLADYQSTAMNWSGVYRTGERSDISLGMEASWLNAETPGTDSTEHGFRAGWHWDRTESQRLSVSVGRYSVEYQGGNAETGVLTNLDWQGKGEVDQWAVAVSRSIAPSGAGILIRRDQISGDYSKSFDTRTALGFNVKYIGNDTLNSGSSGIDRRYRRGALRISRQLTREWSLLGEYSYSRQQLAGSSNAAVDNALTLSLYYSGERQSR